MITFLIDFFTSPFTYFLLYICTYLVITWFLGETFGIGIALLLFFLPPVLIIVAFFNAAIHPKMKLMLGIHIVSLVLLAVTL